MVWLQREKGGREESACNKPTIPDSAEQSLQPGCLRTPAEMSKFRQKRRSACRDEQQDKGMNLSGAQGREDSGTARQAVSPTKI